MSKDRVVEIKTPVQEEDPLTELLRSGSQELIAAVVEAEFSELLSEYSGRVDGQGRRVLVRNGYLPEREIQTGIGPVKPKARDRSGSGIRFHSRLLPPYLRRTKQIAELLPWLYLKGVSTGDFQEALAALLGADAKGLSSGSISRLKDRWREDHARWLHRDLSGKRYVYFWADGVYFHIRGDEARQCILVIVGADEHGIKEFVAIEDGYRESEQSWLEVLSSCKQRGLKIGPELAVGDGALGFWKALSKVYGKSRHQRCWVHKTANVLNKLPRGAQAKAKSALHQIWMAATREEAHRAFDGFLGTYRDKYPKATECLEKDRQELLAFYDFPAAHWQHIRTTNPIESTFATVRLRTRKTRGCVSRQTILALVFQLGQSAQKRWRRLRGFKHLADVIDGVKFENGVRADTGSSGRCHRWSEI
jgi:transposase-like protein